MKKVFLLCTLAFLCQNLTAQTHKRWYSYSSFRAHEYTAIGDRSDTAMLQLWQDTATIKYFTASVTSASGYHSIANNGFQSVALSFSPHVNAWNNAATYGAGIKVRPTDTFYVDSVRILGNYFRNPSKPSVIDTLVCGFVYGNGDTSSNLQDGYYYGMSSRYVFDTVHFHIVAYDSAANTAQRSVASHPIATIQKFLLTSADTANTAHPFTYALSTPYRVPAGNAAAMSVGFKTGDATFHRGDTLSFSSGAIKFNNFSAALQYHTDAAGTTLYAAYDTADRNAGHFQTQSSWGVTPYSTIYVPEYAWFYAGGASVLQEPMIEFHVVCPTCIINDSIAGSNTVCVSANVTLATAAAGGTWSSSNPSVATVSTAGLVTGVAIGTATISYAVSGELMTHVITVDTMPTAGTITGSSILCVGATLTLSATGTGGTWSSVSPSIATVSATGVVTGVSAGVDTIKYSVTSSCATAVATKVIAVNNNPDAGIITGADTVCLGMGITLTESVPGGFWSASNGNATVTDSGSSAGVVGVTAGVVIIKYSVTNVCGTDTAIKVIQVADCITGLANVIHPNDEITIYPNPTADYLNIESNNTVKVVAIYNLLGQKLQEVTGNTTKAEMRINHLAAGVYFLKVNDSQVFKVTKE